MKATSALSFFGFFALAAAAPMLQHEALPDNEESPRGRRSNYGPTAPIGGGYAIPAPNYYSPCASASSHLPYQVNAPALHAGYGHPSYGHAGFGHASYGHAGYGHTLPYGLNTYGPHYRADEGFDDSDALMEMQRAAEEQGAVARSYSYEGPAAHPSVALPSFSSLPSAASGPAVGVFPRGHVSGCNVPLLLSCSPSIVAGQMVHTKPHYGSGAYGGYGSAAGSGSLYRDMDEGTMKDSSGEDLHQTMSSAAHDNMEKAHGAQAAQSSQTAHATPAQASNGASHSSNKAAGH